MLCLYAALAELLIKPTQAPGTGCHSHALSASSLLHDTTSSTSGRATSRVFHTSVLRLPFGCGSVSVLDIRQRKQLPGSMRSTSKRSVSFSSRLAPRFVTVPLTEMLSPSPGAWTLAAVLPLPVSLRARVRQGVLQASSRAHLVFLLRISSA